MVKEKNFQYTLIKYLKEQFGKEIYVINQVSVMHAGIPDLIICYKGMFVGLELKMGKKYKASALQIVNLNRIKDSGGFGAVVEYEENWRKNLVDMFSCIEFRKSEFYYTYPLPDLPKSVKKL